MNTGEKNIKSPELATESLLQEQANKRASADPLPGPLSTAFCEDVIEIAGKRVYPVVPRHFVALKALNSPLISMVQDIVQSGKIDTELTDEQGWEICWVFTHTGKEIREAMQSGIAELRERINSEIGDVSFPVNLVIAAVMEQLKRHLSTAVKYTADAVEKGSVSFFQDTAMPQGREAGGS